MIEIPRYNVADNIVCKLKKFMQANKSVCRTGMTLESIDRNRLVAKMPLEDNDHIGGAMLAAPLFLLAEFSAGLLLFGRIDTKTTVGVCAGVDIRYLRPATSDVFLSTHISDEQFLEMEVALSTKGRYTTNIDAKLYDEHQQLVATADVCYVIKSRV